MVEETGLQVEVKAGGGGGGGGGLQVDPCKNHRPDSNQQSGLAPPQAEAYIFLPKMRKFLKNAILTLGMNILTETLV